MGLGLGISRHGNPLQLLSSVGQSIGLGTRIRAGQLRIFPPTPGWLKQRAPGAIWAVTKGAIMAIRAVMLRNCILKRSWIKVCEE
jgi:hypothetical protein